MEQVRWGKEGGKVKEGGERRENVEGGGIGTGKEVWVNMEGRRRDRERM